MATPRVYFLYYYSSKKFDWCKNIDKDRFYSFDFFIEKLRIIIELDGLQHFKQVTNWSPYKKTQDADIFKMIQANKNNITVVRILQKDVLYNKNNWEKNLKEVIKEYKSPEYIFISSGKEYNVYMEQVNTC